MRDLTGCAPLLCMERRAKHAHWALDPTAAATAGLDVLSVSKAQQWETPWEVYEYVRERWPVQFDACASTLNALAPRYATSTDDFLACELFGETVFCNPPYAMDRYATGSCARPPFRASFRSSSMATCAPAAALRLHSCLRSHTSGGSTN